MQILLAISAKKFRQIALFSLESKKHHVHEASTAGEALEILLKGTLIDLIICETPSFSGPLTKYLGAIQQHASFVEYAATTPSSVSSFAPHNLVASTKESDLDGLLKVVDAFQATQPVLTPAPGDDKTYCKINIDLLRGIKSLQTDVYIRLNSTKFLKLFLKGDEFDAKDRQKYLIDKKISYLYVHRDDALAVVEKFKADLKRLLESKTLDSASVEKTNLAIHEVTTDLIQRIGAVPEVQQMIKDNIMLAVQSMGKNPKLKGFLGKLTADRKSYISSHSISLAQLCCSLAAMLEWESAMTYQKLTMAAFLHDITLTNHELAALQTKSEIDANQNKFTPDELKNYILHPANASSLARSFNELPPDTDNIIQQHHEQPDGSGFPRGLSAKQIMPLSSLFIVAHTLLNEIYDKKDSFNMADFMERNKERYSEGNFKKIYAALKDLEL